MRVGLLKEIKTDENRVALTPGGVQALVQAGHAVLVERTAGVGSGFSDEEYVIAGAKIADDNRAVFANSELITKVKEPLPEEYPLFRRGQILYTYLHLAPERALTQALLEHEVAAVAYETVQLPDRSLPLLTPMSEVAGRMATQIGAQFLEKVHGGKGILLGGVPGVRRAHVVIVGGGTVGLQAATIAVGFGARVTLLDISAARLRQLDELFGGRIETVMSNPAHVAEAVAQADLLIGAVLVPGARAPQLVSEAMVKSMVAGGVIVDVAIDQGGSIETIDHVTTHSHPTYEKHGIVHYAVANMPGAVPRTSTIALTNVTLPYLLKICNEGFNDAMRHDHALAKGVNCYKGHVTYQAVAEAHDLPYVELEGLLN